MEKFFEILITLGIILGINGTIILVYAGFTFAQYMNYHLIPTWKAKTNIKKGEMENERDRKRQLADHELYLETRKRIEQYIVEDRHLREFIKHYAYWKETYEKDYYQDVIEKDLAYIRHKYEYDKNIFITELTQDILYFYDLVVKIEEEDNDK